MKRFADRIPSKVLKEIFPKRFNRNLAAEQIYTHLEQTILSGKLRKGQKLLHREIARDFGVSSVTVAKVFSRLKKNGLVIVRRRVGSFVA